MTMLAYKHICAHSVLHTETQDNHTFSQDFLNQVIRVMYHFWLHTINRMYTSDFMGKQNIQKAKNSVLMDLHVFIHGKIVGLEK